MSTLENLKRTDALGMAVFEVCMALVATGVALAFAVDLPAVRVVAAAVAAVTIFVAMSAVPDTVVGAGQPDRTDESIARYVKQRQRHTQIALIWLLTVATFGASGAAGFVFYELSDVAWLAIMTGAGGVVGGVIGGLQSREGLWPPEIRND